MTTEDRPDAEFSPPPPPPSPPPPNTLPGRPRAAAGAWTTLGSSAGAGAARSDDEFLGYTATIAGGDEPFASTSPEDGPDPARQKAGAPRPRSRRTRWLAVGGLGLLAIGVTAALVLPSVLGGGSDSATLQPYPDEPTPGWSVAFQEVWDAAGGAPADLPLWSYLSGAADHAVLQATGTDTSGAGSTALAGVDLETGDLTWSRLLDDVLSCREVGAELLLCEGADSEPMRYQLIDLVTGEDLGTVDDLIAADDGLVVSARHEPGTSTMTVIVREGIEDLWTRQIDLSSDQQSLADDPVYPYVAVIADDVVVLQFYGYQGTTLAASSVLLSRADGAELGTIDGVAVSRLADAWLVADGTGYGLRALDGSAAVPLEPAPRSIIRAHPGGRRIVYPAANDEIVALDVGASGSSVWTAQAWAHPLESAGGLAEISHVTDSVVLAEGYSYSGNDREVIALSARDGTELWRAPGRLVGTDGERAVVQDEPTTSAFRMADGSPVWSMETTGEVRDVAGRLFDTDLVSTYTILTP